MSDAIEKQLADLILADTAEVERIKNEVLKPAVERLSSLIHEFNLVKYKVKPGVIVETPKGEYLVTRVDMRWYPNTPWIHGRAKKKDGSWSDRETYIYAEWNVVSKSP